MLTECLEPRWALCAGDVGAIEIAAGCDFNGSCVEFPTQVAAGSLPGEQGAADPQYAVKHTPYLQLGNAPLVGLPGSETDQIEIVWQTIPAGAGTEDAFVVEYRVAGAAAWTSAAAPTTLNTGVQGRINWSVVIAGLTYHSDYEYRVRHVRAGMDVATYQHGFQTRLAAGDPTPFQFAAYGDSAAAVSPSGRPERFIPVQNRINASEAAFALLLGDNAYENATHVEFDLRMDPAVNPATTEFTASRVDYYVMGNHDFASVGTAGRPTVENYSVPVPVEGVTSPVAGPATALPERNYSFDYGSAHFVAFDSTPCEFSTPHCVSNPQRWQDQLAWLIADLQASSARWKVVFAHIPLATLSAYQSPIHPGTTYYEQLLGALQVGGADLYLAGHDHSWQRSYPLTGRIGNQATFVLDTDGEYEKGAGLVQVVSGLGGRSLYTGAIETDQYVARGYNGSTSPLARYGHAQVDVAVDRITVQYVAADNGEVLDSVSIVASNEPEPPTITRVIVGNDVEQAAVPVGSGEQLRTLPIGGVDRITLEFSRPMVGLVTPSLSLLGRDGA